MSFKASLILALLGAVVAFFIDTRPVAAQWIPFPVTIHPRLWITTDNLPRPRGWATPSNPIFWLQPNHITIYDRATSQTAGLFGRFNLCLPAAPRVAPTQGGGSVITETLTNRQELFIASVLPVNGLASVDSLAGLVTSMAKASRANQFGINETGRRSTG